MMKPLYLKDFESGKLREKREKLRQMLSACRLCPRNCGVDRLAGEAGFCGARATARVSSYFPHFGEEKCLVGERGSGTIFFAYCNLKCAFCQNYEISHLARGRDISEEELASFMLELQCRGCHNINLVTPTHFVYNILGALEIAAEKGLNLPLVYNCGGYESEEVIKVLEGVVDIYMPDAKFASGKKSDLFCMAPDYFENFKKVVKIMYKQVGDLRLENGIARRGLLVRHLVMPGGVEDSALIMKFLYGISKGTFVNIMGQYHPCGQARKFAEINRRITVEEYSQVALAAKKIGLHRFD